MTAMDADFIEWERRFCGFLLQTTGGGSVARERMKVVVNRSAGNRRWGEVSPLSRERRVANSGRGATNQAAAERRSSARRDGLAPPSSWSLFVDPVFVHSDEMVPATFAGMRWLSKYSSILAKREGRSER